MNVITQITTNIIRPLPPSLIIYFDPDEDEPTMEPTWPHLSVGCIMYLWQPTDPLSLQSAFLTSYILWTGVSPDWANFPD